MTDLPADPSPFITIAVAFDRNIRALRVFAKTIALHADAHDVEAMTKFRKTVDELAPSRRVEPSPAQLVEGGGAPDTTDTAAPDAVTQDSHSLEPDDDDASGPDFHEVFENPGLRKRFEDALEAMSRAAPIQGHLLRASAVISLMSHVESLIADLVHQYYARFPGALPGEERSITLAELRELGSVEEAEKLLVSKEIDSLLRDTLEKQIDYFSKRPKIDVSALEQYMSTLIELDQRRNLLVHNRGVVNRMYLKRVEASLVSSFELKEGADVRITPEYLSKALDLVEICGNILIQLCWRKWSKEEVRQADHALNHIGLYEALKDGRYEVVVRLGTFGLSVGLASDEIARMVCLNKATAHRHLGERGAVEATIGTMDWSASSLVFRVALHAVKQEDDACFGLIPTAVLANELTRDDLDEWPLFAMMRTSPRWQNDIPLLFQAQSPADG